MKIRKNYFKILCSMAFCFTLGVTGCNSSGNGGSSDDPGAIPEGSYLVTFDAGGGTMTSPTTQVVKSGEKVPAPRMPTYDGYVFEGWFLEPNYTKATPFDFDSPITSTTTIYAGWSIDRDYFGGGGSGGGGGGDEPVSETTRKVTEEWANSTYIYMWNDSGSKNAEWPGVKLTGESEDNGYGKKNFTVDFAGYENLIINNGQGTQTSDTKLSTLLSTYANGFYVSGSNILGW